MARPRNDGTMTIAALEQMLLSKRRRLERLQKERDRLQRRLEMLERKIAAIAGGGGGLATRVRLTAGGRVRNPKSLVATLEQVLREAGKPLSVSEILERVQASGYRSSSANFRALVNQTLIKEKRFAKVDRGVYQLKK